MLPPSSTTLQVRTTAPADNVAKTNCMHSVIVSMQALSQLSRSSHMHNSITVNGATCTSLTENTLPGFCDPADKQIANVSVKTCKYTSTSCMDTGTSQVQCKHAEPA